jgi:hypothetical protein
LDRRTVRKTAKCTFIPNDPKRGSAPNQRGSCKRLLLEMIARPAFPVAKDDDDDDVAWALSTAQVQWKRGSQADAVVWLRRAIDSAVSVGATWRAAELTRQTDDLEAALMRGEPVGPSSVPSAVAIDDFDGTDMIDDEAMSLPPDADMAESLRAPLHETRRTSAPRSRRKTSSPSRSKPKRTRRK